MKQWGKFIFDENYKHYADAPKLVMELHPDQVLVARDGFEPLTSQFNETVH